MKRVTCYRWRENVSRSAVMLEKNRVTQDTFKPMVSLLKFGVKQPTLEAFSPVPRLTGRKYINQDKNWLNQGTPQNFLILAQKWSASYSSLYIYISIIWTKQEWFV